MEELSQRLQLFASRNTLLLQEKLGFGIHGLVFLADKGGWPQSALKAHKYRESYEKELESYKRLKRACVATIEGLHVPELLHWDDGLLVIEMSVVSKPYVLDFAGVSLDEPVEFSEEILQEWQAEKREQFGVQWPVVLRIVDTLKIHGIYVNDVSPSNIAFE